MFVDNDGDMGTSVLRQKVFVVYLQKVSWLLAVGCWVWSCVVRGRFESMCLCKNNFAIAFFEHEKYTLLQRQFKNAV